VILVAVAVRHVLLATSGVEGAARHWLFVLINLALAAILVMRHRWAFWPTLLLGVQQMASHGLDLSKSFLGNAPLDVPSLAVCLFFPTLATILYLERADEKEKLEEAKYEKKSPPPEKEESAPE
jgi:hypothetical protein